MQFLFKLPVGVAQTRRLTAGFFNKQIGQTTTLLLLLGLSASSWGALALSEVEQLALQADPQVLAQRARSGALQSKSVADGQLPDPKLSFGLYNVPLDDFDLQKQPTTQFRSKIQQAFPRGNSLQYQQQYTAWMGKAEQARSMLTTQQLQRDVRQVYLELYYQLQAEQVVKQSRKLFQQLVVVTRSMFSSGRANQQDVLQAQLELSRLDERATRIAEQEDVQRASLSRWIGDAAWQPIATEFPSLPRLPLKHRLQQGLAQHPAMKVSDAKVSANQQLIKRAREQYKPGWNVGLEYRKRFGNNPDGSDREDMMAAMVTFDLPIFTNNRQDQRLAASQRNTQAARQQREVRLRELQRQLSADYARWQRLGEQQQLYRTHLMQEVLANTQATIYAYKNGTSGFVALTRASVTELNVRLQQLRIDVDRAKAQSRLLYLQPELANAPIAGVNP